ncbi:MAG: sigma-54-dependent Fis family transcriptional regulator [Bacteroidales bacterium]|nr:sigma-54-dependent Fis family transcriptional regulator [Bacteroidales bacterium]MBR5093015.1 sigma-54-dependent Fis family transcriptional regulator [Bacteroidales bacterium]
MDIKNIKLRYDIIGNDPKLELALNKAIQVAPTDLSILITGESGVGKDVFSRIIHENSLRKHVRQGRGLISVNCGAIPEGTIESELFGHVKGAFTGADRSRKGYFEEADGGTIFLDEIGELPLAMQVKLLRVLENGEIIPVGSSTAQKINVRVVAATNVDIVEAVRNGRFREDLYYRLNQISIYLPPLRERKDDVPLLFRKFSSDVAEKYHMPPIVLTDEAKRMMMDYPWYGNVRELKNITEQIAVVETERTITPAILQNYLSFVPTGERMPAVVENGSQTVGGSQITDRELLLKALSMGQMINEMRKEINDLRNAVTQMAQGMPVQGQVVQQSSYLPQVQHEDEEFITPEIVDDDALSLEDREKHAILKALEHAGGNRKLAAAELHISERTLYRKLKGYNIEQ